MPFFESDGVRLFYREWGDGQPVLFLSSWGMSSDFWQYQMAFLSEHRFRCVALDRRGHGRSDDPGRGFDYDTLAGDVAALIEHLDLRGVTLVGHSMAGGEIVRYLTRFGDDRVAACILVSATLPFPLKTSDNPDGVDGAFVERARSGWHDDFPRWVKENSPPFFGEGLPGCDVSPSLADWGIRDLTRTSLRAIIDCNRAAIETDFRQEMRRIDVATLVIHGDHDSSIPLEIASRKSAQLMPNSKLRVYRNGPHGLPLTHVAELNNDLLSFLRAHLGEPPFAESGLAPAG